jgi:predicted O-methyltransferase YrrM
MDRDTIVRLSYEAEYVPVYPDPRFPPSLYYRFLRCLAEHMQPELSVELGVCGGGASLHLCLGSPGHVIGIDYVNSYPDNVTYIQSHFQNFSFWEMDSIEAARLAGDPVDILFIDTVHTYERTMAEFDAWKCLLYKGSVVCLDDLFREGMDRAWEELPGEKVRLDFLHHGGSPTDGGFGCILV